MCITRHRHIKETLHKEWIWNEKRSLKTLDFNARIVPIFCESFFGLTYIYSWCDLMNFYFFCLITARLYQQLWLWKYRRIIKFLAYFVASQIETLNVKELRNSASKKEIIKAGADFAYKASRLIITLTNF